MRKGGMMTADTITDIAILVCVTIIICVFWFTHRDDY